MISNLLLVLRFRVDDDFRNEGEEDVFEELGSHDVACPVVSVLHHVEHVPYATHNERESEYRSRCESEKLTLDLNFAVEISVVEDLHRNLGLAVVLGA